MIPPADDTWYERIDGLPERVSSGGAVVRLDRGALLVALVRERNEDLDELSGYVLPKGGVEEGESIEAAAVREIEEEAGLTELTTVGPLAVLERLSERKNYWSINHYSLFLTDQEAGDIKDREHHFDFGWFPLDNLPEMFWRDERELLSTRRKAIYDQVIALQNPKPRKRMFM